MTRILALLAALLFGAPALAQTPGTLNLTGPSTTPGAPLISPAALSAAINAQLATKADVGALPNLASPGCIGCTTPNTGAFNSTIPTIPAIALGSNTFNAVAAAINGASGAARWFRWQTAGINRWQIGPNGAETGSNTGADFAIAAFDDAGTNLARGLTLTRASGGLALTTNNVFASNTANNIASSGLFFSQTFSGVSGVVGGAVLDNINIVDTVDGSAATQGLTGFSLLHNYGGGTTKGGRTAAAFTLVQSGGANTDSGVDRFYVGLVGNAYARFTQPGSSAANPLGAVFGFNGVGQIQPGFTATNLRQVSGAEFDVRIPTASSALIRTGIGVANLGNVQGYGVDAGYWLYDSGAAPFRYGFLFGDTQGWPVDPTVGTMIGTNIGASLATNASANQAKWGFDANVVTFPSTGNPYDGGFLRSNGFSVDGVGTTRIGTAYLTPSAAGMTIDAKGAVSTGVTIAVAGSGYAPGGFHAFSSPYGGVWYVAIDLTGVPNGAVTQITPASYPSTTTPANPVTAIELFRNPQGSGLTLTIGWSTTANALALQPTGGATTIGGALGVSGITTLTGNVVQNGSKTITVNGGLGISTISGGTITTTHLNSGLGTTFNLTGSTGSPTNVNTALLTSANLTGTPASGTVSLNRFVVNSDDLDGTNLLAGASAISLDHNFGGPNLRGGRTAALFNMTQTANVTAQTAPGSNSFVVGGFHLATASNLGGTNTAAGAKGFYYSLYPQLILHSGATNIALANLWGEGDIAVEAGASVKSIYGRSIVLLPSHAVAGTSENIVDLITAGGGAVPTWTNGYTFGGTGANWPMAATATLQGTIVQAFCGGAGKTCQAPTEAATYGTDWSSLDLAPQSGFGFRSPGFAVDAVGQGWFANGLNLTATATGYSVDIPNAQAVTAVVPSTAGSATGDGQNNYYPGDLLYGSGTPTPGQYRITHTKVIGAVVAAGGSGGTPGACTITGTTGTGTKFQATGTVTAGALGGALVVSVAGDYTVNPSSLTAESVTGCGLTGTTVGPGMGALTLTVQVPDVFAACPGAGGIAPTGGSGGALTLTPTCGLRDGITLAGATRKLGLYGATPIAKATPVGACAGNTGCQALRDALANLGAINAGSVTN